MVTQLGPIAALQNAAKAAAGSEDETAKSKGVKDAAQPKMRRRASADFELPEGWQVIVKVSSPTIAVHAQDYEDLTRCARKASQQEAKIKLS